MVKAFGHGIAAALIAALMPASAAAQCSAAAPAIAADLWMPPPVLDNSLPRAAIQRRAPTRHQGHAIGLYRGRLETRVEVKFGVAPQQHLLCVSVTAIIVDMAIAGRRIYVAHEWGPGSCGYDAILGHERKHQAADEQALREAAPRMRQAIGNALRAIGPLAVAPSRQAAAVRQLMDAVQTSYREQDRILRAEQTRLQQAVDAGFEYARLTASCPEFDAHYDPYAPLPPKGADDGPLLPGLR